MPAKYRAESLAHFNNRLNEVRTARGLSQTALARLSGITRQAIHAIETGRYLPTTAVALRLAEALNCRVEDLFSLASRGDVMEGEWLGPVPQPSAKGTPCRVKVAIVGDRVVVRPVATLGDVLAFTVPADGLVEELPAGSRSTRAGRRLVRVRLLKERRAIEQAIAVAGCDPAVFLVSEYLARRQAPATVVGWTMGSAAAVEALRNRGVHMAGLHVVDAQSGESNLPYLRRCLPRGQYTVVTFASWEQGLIVQRGNPKQLRAIEDLARRTVTLINREPGSGARLLLDHHMTRAGLRPEHVRGYDRLARSHLEVARAVAEGRADVGIGVLAAARLLGLDFIPLQHERYDLVLPTSYLSTHRALSVFLDALVSQPFRSELMALGGYETTETGKVHVL